MFGSSGHMICHYWPNNHIHLFQSIGRSTSHALQVNVGCFGVFFWCKIIDKFICHFECHLLHYIKRKKIKSRIIWKNFLSCNRKSEEKFLIVTGNLSSISIIYYHIYIPNICLSVKTISKSTLVKAPPPFHTHTRKKIKQKTTLTKYQKANK